MNSRAIKIKEKWDKLSDDWNRFRADQIIMKIINDPYSYFRAELQALFKRFIGDFADKNILVIGSGSGRAAFAFHLLGARVTASDLSEKQLEYSAEVAKRHNWNMDFVCDDAVTLYKIESNKYDFVYIPNGVMFWIKDLQAMYTSIRRVLKDDGIYMMYDMHPFMPPFEFDNTEKLVLKKDYDAVGPFGDMEVYNWRLQDFFNSMVSAGLNFVHMEEMKAAYGTFWVDEDKADDMPKNELAKFYDSKTNPIYALPQCLSIVAQKSTV